MKVTRSQSPIFSRKQLANAVFYLLVAALVVIYIIFEPQLMTLQQVKGYIASYDSRSAVYMIAFVIMLLCALTPLPAELIALANAMVFSPLEAFFVSWVSAVLSAHIGYELGRLNWFNPCEAGDDRRICHWLRAHGYQALAVMRLMPVVPSFVLNICGGVFKLNRYKYNLITMLCILPAVALLSFFPQLFR